ncbi:MAG: glycosyltransferase family 4 protein [Terriglobales bacterium]|jgi:glycosyltransferase involved in cell wall biosynthesis
MNVLILFSHRWRGGRAGGAETHARDLIKGLAAKGHSIVFVTGKADDGCRPGLRDGASAHFELSFQTINPLDKLKTYRRLAEIVAEHRIEVIHAHHRTAGYFAELLCRRKHIPYVVTVHDPWHSTPFKKSHGRAFRRLIAVSDYLQRVFIARFHVPPERIRTIRNGVDPSRFEGIAHAEAARFRSAFSVGADEIVLSQISRISKAKGQFDLLHALRLLPPDLRYRCLIVGEGKERASLERLAESLGLSRKVTFCGYQSNIPVVLAATDVMLLPSHREPLGLSIIEAMLSNVPVIAANAGGVPEIITHGKDGLLFPAGDIPALARLIMQMVRDTSLRQQLAQAGRRTAIERFLVGRMIDETEAYYQRILEESTTTANFSSTHSRRKQ